MVCPSKQRAEHAYGLTFLPLSFCFFSSPLPPHIQAAKKEVGPPLGPRLLQAPVAARQVGVERLADQRAARERLGFPHVVRHGERRRQHHALPRARGEPQPCRKCRAPDALPFPILP